MEYYNDCDNVDVKRRWWTQGEVFGVPHSKGSPASYIITPTPFTKYTEWHNRSALKLLS